MAIRIIDNKKIEITDDEYTLSLHTDKKEDLLADFEAELYDEGMIEDDEESLFD